MSAMEMIDEHDFTVTSGATSQTVTGRMEAVILAKSLSRDGHHRVSVERDDGTVTMQFSNGSLDSLVCETRDRRS